MFIISTKHSSQHTNSWHKLTIEGANSFLLLRALNGGEGGPLSPFPFNPLGGGEEILFSDCKIKIEKEVLRRMFVSSTIVCLLLLSEGGSGPELGAWSKCG